MKYIFGPLKSRRLGNSLGVNLFARKTCTFDCVYCQLGPTPVKISKSVIFSDLKRLITELRIALKSNSNVDYITFAGLGEPTLVKNLGGIITAIKEVSAIPVAVITNSSLLSRKSVRESLLKADLVIPSLDAIESGFFRLINRPCKAIKLNSIINGLENFRSIYKGDIWLEIMLVKEFKLNKAQINQYKKLMNSIKPEAVHLVRPARVKNSRIHSCSKREMLRFREIFGSNCKIF